MKQIILKPSNAVYLSEGDKGTLVRALSMLHTPEARELTYLLTTHKYILLKDR